MSDDNYKIYEKAVLAFQKLEPNPGDIIVVKFPDDVHPNQMAAFAEGLQQYVPPDVVILFSRAGVEIDKISETEMNKRGWYRFDTTKDPH